MTNSSPTVTNSYLYGAIKNFSINLLNKFDPTKGLDITAHIIGLTIYEDIFSDCMTGVVSILDALDLLNGIQTSSTNASFPIIGEEVLHLTLEILGQTKYTGVFEVYGIDNISTDSNFKVKTYNLKFCSREKIVDSYMVIQKGYNQPISQTAENVFTQIIKKEVDRVYTKFSQNAGFASKTIVTEDSNGSQKIVIPRLSPFETMQFLKKRATSASSKNTSGTYLFFEDRYNYHFCDIEQLIENGLSQQQESLETSDGTSTTSISNPNAISPYKYAYSPQSNRSDVNLTTSSDLSFSLYKVITKMTQHTRFDTIEKLRYGVYDSDILAYDFIQKIVTNTKYNYKSAPPVVTLGSNPENSNSFLTDLDGKYTRKYFIAIDSSLPPTYSTQIIPRRASYLTRLSEGMFTIETMGDLTLKVGDVIYISIPNLADEGVTNDKLYSGNFLIGSIKHNITPSSYYTTIDVYKIGLENPVGV